MRKNALHAGAAAAIAAISLSAPASAINDPELAWFTVETDHFRVHYPTGLEAIAERVARVSETVHDRLTGPLGYKPSGKTEVLVTDNSELANGSATALPYNAVRLYVAAPDDMSPLTDYDDWLVSLITHEYTHILHVDNISGVASVINAILGKTYSPNQAQPRWIIEGLATMSESVNTSGGRLRSSIFNMYMRADVIEDRIARLDQISSNPFRWPQGNLWYLYGSQFLGWINEVYGPNTWRALSADYGGTTLPWAINRSIRRVTGRTYEELYDGFKDRLKRTYAEQMRKVEDRGLIEGTRLTWNGGLAWYPRFLPKASPEVGPELVYYREDQDARTGIYKLPLHLRSPDAKAAPKVEPGERTSALLARTRGSSTPSFNANGDLYFVSTAQWRNYYDREDVFSLPAGVFAPRGDEPERKRLTQGLRTSSVDISPDGKRIAFTSQSRGTSYLQLADVDAEGQIQNPRELVPSQRFEQAYTPRFSPDGRSLAYSHWRAGGFRDVRVVDLKTGAIRTITDDRALDMHPVFSPAGDTLYFVSDRSGIPNVYAYDLEKATLRQVTNVRTGAFCPAPSPDGKYLAYAGYTSRGYDLFAMPLDPSKFIDAPPPLNDRPDPPTEPAPVAMKKSDYSPLRTLAPRNWFLSLAPGRFSDNAVTVDVDGSDIAGLHSMSARIVADPGAPAPEFSVSYGYNRLPFNFSLRAFHLVAPRNNYFISDRQVNYNERIIGASASISAPIYEEFSRHTLSVSFSAASSSAELPVGSKLDPYASITRVPRQGNINIVRLGYSFSNVEGALGTPGAARGFTLDSDVEFGGPLTGSMFTTYSFSLRGNAYVPVPWPWKALKNHTLALRAGAAVSGGEYPRGNTYAVGGYDLERNDLPGSALSGVLNGAFVLRGYAPNAFGGKEYILANAEYRFPIVQPDIGPATLPVYLRRIDANLFVDAGGAFNDFGASNIRFFRNDRFLDAQWLHASAGLELWVSFIVGYGLNTQLRFGYARGFSADALPDGQLYVVASGPY